jgi:putative PIN family toxin of toxin-antitoxin system
VTVAVLDTNVLASALVTPAGIPGRLLDLWLVGRFELAISDGIVQELERTVAKPYFQRRVDSVAFRDLVAVLVRLARRADPVPLAGVASHPEGDLIIGTALASSADYLVTGDAALLALGSHGGVRIISPRDFLALLQQPAEEEANEP